MAELVRAQFFDGRGKTVQFHPAVTYEDFVVGLAPDPVDAGLKFKPKPGYRAARTTGERRGQRIDANEAGHT